MLVVSNTDPGAHERRQTSFARMLNQIAGLPHPTQRTSTLTLQGLRGGTANMGTASDSC